MQHLALIGILCALILLLRPTAISEVTTLQSQVNFKEYEIAKEGKPTVNQLKECHLDDMETRLYVVASESTTENLSLVFKKRRLLWTGTHPEEVCKKEKSVRKRVNSKLRCYRHFGTPQWKLNSDRLWREHHKNLKARRKVSEYFGKPNEMQDRFNKAQMGNLAQETVKEKVNKQEPDFMKWRLLKRRKLADTETRKRGYNAKRNARKRRLRFFQKNQKRKRLYDVLQDGEESLANDISHMQMRDGVIKQRKRKRPSHNFYARCEDKGGMSCRKDKQVYDETDFNQEVGAETLADVWPLFVKKMNSSAILDTSKSLAVVKEYVESRMNGLTGYLLYALVTVLILLPIMCCTVCIFKYRKSKSDTSQRERKGYWRSFLGEKGSARRVGLKSSAMQYSLLDTQDSEIEEQVFYHRTGLRAKEKQEVVCLLHQAQKILTNDLKRKEWRAKNDSTNRCVKEMRKNDHDRRLTNFTVNHDVFNSRPNYPKRMQRQQQGYCSSPGDTDELSPRTVLLERRTSSQYRQEMLPNFRDTGVLCRPYGGLR